MYTKHVSSRVRSCGAMVGAALKDNKVSTRAWEVRTSVRGIEAVHKIFESSRICRIVVCFLSGFFLPYVR